MAMPRSLSPLFLLLLVSSAPFVRPVPAVDNLQDACNKTLFPKVCIHALTTNPESRTANARRLAELSVYVAAEVGTTVAAFAHHELNGVKEDVLFKCLDSCSEDIEEAVAHLSALTRELTDAKFLEVKAWLSATLGGTSTCEDTCKDAPVSDIKNAVVTKSLEFEKLLRVTLDLITEASGSMSASVALPPSAWEAGAPSAYGSATPPTPYGSTEGPAVMNNPADSPAPSYGSSAGGPTGSVDSPAPSTGSADSPAPSYGSSAGGPTGSADSPAPSDGSSAVKEEVRNVPADSPAPSYGSSSGKEEMRNVPADSPASSDGSANSPAPSAGPPDGEDTA